MSGSCTGLGVLVLVWSIRLQGDGLPENGLACAGHRHAPIYQPAQGEAFMCRPRSQQQTRPCRRHARQQTGMWPRQLRHPGMLPWRKHQVSKLHTMQLPPKFELAGKKQCMQDGALQRRGCHLANVTLKP